MKIKTLFESSSPLTKSMVEKIIKDCKPFIDEVIDLDENRLYRGLQLSSFKRRSEEIAEDVYKAKVRIGRVPLNTPTYIHEFMDEWMATELGVRFRSESIFCAGERTTALSFGNPYVILPIGKFSYAWSPSISDVFSDVEEICYAAKRANEENAAVIPRIREVLEQAAYKTDDLIRAIKEFPTHEVMISCEEYYAFEPSVFRDYFYQYYQMIR